MEVGKKFKASGGTFADASTTCVVAESLRCLVLKSTSHAKGQCTSDSGSDIVGFIGKQGECRGAWLGSKDNRTLLWLGSKEIQARLSSLSQRTVDQLTDNGNTFFLV